MKPATIPNQRPTVNKIHLSDREIVIGDIVVPAKSLFQFRHLPLHFVLNPDVR
jgi:hypothetical protein